MSVLAVELQVPRWAEPLGPTVSPPPRWLQGEEDISIGRGVEYPAEHASPDGFCRGC